MRSSRRRSSHTRRARRGGLGNDHPTKSIRWRSTIPRGPRMNDALRYEWTRIRTIRSTWWLTGSALAIALLISVLLGWVGHHDFSRNGASAEDVDGLGPFLVTQFAASGQIPSLVGFLVAMIGIFAWGHEYRHGMIRASLTALNSRSALWTEVPGGRRLGRRGGPADPGAVRAGGGAVPARVRR